MQEMEIEAVLTGERKLLETDNIAYEDKEYSISDSSDYLKQQLFQKKRKHTKAQDKPNKKKVLWIEKPFILKNGTIELTFAETVIIIREKDKDRKSVDQFSLFSILLSMFATNPEDTKTFTVFLSK